MPTPEQLNQNPGCFGALVLALQRLGQATTQEPFQHTPQETFYYARLGSLLTPAEQRFYHVLMQAVGDKAAIMAKVRLADIFKVTMSGRGYYRQFNRIAMKHVDFLLCEHQTLKPLMGIELDDSSHARADRIQRDNEVDRIFSIARLPLLHIPAARAHLPAELSAKIEHRFRQPH